MQTKRMSSGRFYCLTARGYLVQTETFPRSSIDGAQRSTQRCSARERAPGWHSRREMFPFSLIISISSSHKNKVTDLPSLELQTDKKEKGTLYTHGMKGGEVAHLCCYSYRLYKCCSTIQNRTYHKKRSYLYSPFHQKRFIGKHPWDQKSLCSCCFGLGSFLDGPL